MAHLAFDTLKFVERLKDSGMPELQAKALAEVQKEVLSESVENMLATKQDIYGLKQDISDAKQDVSNFKSETKERFSKIESDMRLLKWMGGLILAGVSSLILKAFF